MINIVVLADRVDASVDATDVECPTCYAWIGWACNGPNYGYHAAGYHLARERAAKRAADVKMIDLATLQGKETR